MRHSILRWMEKDGVQNRAPIIRKMIQLGIYVRTPMSRKKFDERMDAYYRLMLQHGLDTSGVTVYKPKEEQ